jgi:rare lipoprotein A
MRGVSGLSVTFVACALFLTLSASAVAEPVEPAVPIPFASTSDAYSDLVADLDEAATRALELEREITAIQAESGALQQRLEVVADRARRQRAEVDRATSLVAEARDKYERRLIDVYKRGVITPLTLLLSSDTVAELFSRASILTRIAEDDGRVVADLNLALAEARYQESVLDDLHSQDKALQQEQQARLATLTKTLADQDALVGQLTEKARATLTQARKLDADTRQQWRASSIPLGVDIPRATAMVEPYTDRAYVCSAYMPRTYTTTGEAQLATCSWYGNEFHGRPSASGQIFNENDFTCASRTLPFGTVLALTRGDKRIIVYVNDRGPFVAGRDLDLSKAAALALGFAGVEQVHAEIVTPAPE